MSDRSRGPAEGDATGSTDRGSLAGDERRVVVLNPASGSGDHAQQVRGLAAEHGFAVVETTPDDGAVPVVERLADEADLIAAAGGDGTLNEVVRGLCGVDALGDTTVGVVPAGTGNNFADKVGVESIAHAFEVLVDGERRRIDLGVVSGDGAGAGSVADAGPGVGAGAGARRPFVNSCVCGLTAEASSSTSPDQKDRLGTLAYVVETIREAQEFDPIPLEVRTSDAADVTWEGEAFAVLVGNGRRFPPPDADDGEGDGRGTARADMEDGRFDVTIVEAAPTLDLVGEEARRRLLAGEGDHLTRLQTPALDLLVREDGPQSFSLDGEIVDASAVHVAVNPGALQLCVGEAYDPHPDG